MSHLERNHLVNPSQHGFLPGISCCTNLLEIMEEVTKNVDKGKPRLLIKYLKNTF